MQKGIMLVVDGIDPATGRGNFGNNIQHMKERISSIMACLQPPAALLQPLALLDGYGFDRSFEAAG